MNFEIIAAAIIMGRMAPAMPPLSIPPGTASEGSRLIEVPPDPAYKRSILVQSYVINTLVILNLPNPFEAFVFLRGEALLSSHQEVGKVLSSLLQLNQ